MMTYDGVLVSVQFPSNCGYAIERLEQVFFAMACALTGSAERVHFAYPDLSGGAPRSLPAGFRNVIRFDARSKDADMHAEIAEYVRRHRIGVVFGFDFPVQAPGYAPLRNAGVHTIVAYWGAPISAPNRGLRLLAKRAEVKLRRLQPDHYIFESEAMRQLATDGRGIGRDHTSVVPLAVDPERHAPAPDGGDYYAHDTFGIPRERRIVLYSGHMSPRKGVAVLLQAARHLVAERGRRDIHFLLLGNREGEAEAYAEYFRDPPMSDQITFGGYRQDIHRIQPGCYLGSIASTGWDSYTLSSVEMASCGLPLVVSNLQGLAETVDPGRTGMLFPAGDSVALANCIEALLDDPVKRDAMGRAARERVLMRHTQEAQIRHLTRIVRRVSARCSQQASAQKSSKQRPFVEILVTLMAASLIDME